MTIFAIVHKNGQDVAATYDGMSIEAVVKMISDQGFTADFVDKSTHDAFVLAQQPTPLTPEQLVTFLRSVAINEVDSGTQPLIKVQRAAISLLIDELNLLRQRDNDRATDVAAATSLADLKIRWATRPNLPDRTLAQAKTAIQNKVNAGTAD